MKYAVAQAQPICGKMMFMVMPVPNSKSYFDVARFGVFRTDPPCRLNQCWFRSPLESIGEFIDRESASTNKRVADAFKWRVFG